MGRLKLSTRRNKTETKQFKTVLKLFASVSFRCADSFRQRRHSMYDSCRRHLVGLRMRCRLGLYQCNVNVVNCLHVM